MIALDCVMEYSQGLELCNRRKSITEYKPCYPKVDFSHIEDQTKRHNGGQKEKKLLKNYNKELILCSNLSRRGKKNT